MTRATAAGAAAQANTATSRIRLTPRNKAGTALIAHAHEYDGAKL